MQYMPTPEDFKKVDNDQEVTIQNIVNSINDIHMSKYFYDEKENCFVAPFKFEKEIETEYLSIFETYYANKYGWRKVSLLGVKNDPDYNYIIILHN